MPEQTEESLSENVKEGIKYPTFVMPYRNKDIEMDIAWLNVTFVLQIIAIHQLKLKSRCYLIFYFFLYFIDVLVD